MSGLRWLLLGAAATFLLFEAGFRVLGVFFDRSGARADARHTILCEGDSFTYGIGGKSFPQQLENILNDRAGSRLYRVVNNGIPGLNTALLADRIEESLRADRPDVLIVVVGENNSWNSIRLSDPADGAGRMRRLDRLLLRSRVYKFVKVMAIGWGHGTFHEWDRSKADEVERAAHHLTETEESIGLPGPEVGGDEDDDDEREEESDPLGDVPADSRAVFERAQTFERDGKYDRAIVEYKTFVDKHPALVRGYTGLGGAYMRYNRFDEAIAALKKGVNAQASAEKQAAYFELGWAYRRSGRVEEAVRAWTEGLKGFPESKMIYQSLAKLNHENGNIWKTLEVERDNPKIADNLLHRYLKRLNARHGSADIAALISEDFRRDIRRIAELSRRYGAKVIFSSYPDHAYDEVREAAGESAMSYVDFRPIFKRTYKSRSEYISADDCHCNTAGYGTMAEIFAGEVEKLLNR